MPVAKFAFKPGFILRAARQQLPGFAGPYQVDGLVGKHLSLWGVKGHVQSASSAA